VGLLDDAAAVFRALAEKSPQSARELARSSGVEGDRLQMAVVWLEERGEVERQFDTLEDRTASFSSVRLKPHAAGRTSGSAVWAARRARSPRR
jgi:DNA-binding MarR family transcriptional regulator